MRARVISGRTFSHRGHGSAPDRPRGRLRRDKQRLQAPHLDSEPQLRGRVFERLGAVSPAALARCAVTAEAPESASAAEAAAAAGEPGVALPPRIRSARWNVCSHQVRSRIVRLLQIQVRKVTPKKVTPRVDLQARGYSKRCLGATTFRRTALTSTVSGCPRRATTMSRWRGMRAPRDRTW